MNYGPSNPHLPMSQEAYLLLREIKAEKNTKNGFVIFVIFVIAIFCFNQINIFHYSIGLGPTIEIEKR